MPKLGVMDRTAGFFKKNLETMLHKKRIEYHSQKLRGIVQYASKNSQAFKNKMDSVPLVAALTAVYLVVVETVKRRFFSWHAAG